MSIELNLNNDWYEIHEPKTNKRLFVNSTTGKRQTKCPEKYHKRSDNQCWELFDFKTYKLYYYIVKTKECTWTKPDNGLFVSLVKYQYLKERKKKTFVDKSLQVDAEFDLNIQSQQMKSKLSINDDNDANSLDNIETSGYSTIHSLVKPTKAVHSTYQLPSPPQHNNTTNIINNNNYNHNNNHITSSSTESLDNLTAPSTVALPTIFNNNSDNNISTNRRTLPRTNPNYVRHDYTMRLSESSDNQLDTPTIPDSTGADEDEEVVNISKQNVTLVKGLSQSSLIASISVSQSEDDDIPNYSQIHKSKLVDDESESLDELGIRDNSLDNESNDFTNYASLPAGGSSRLKNMYGTSGEYSDDLESRDGADEENVGNGERKNGDIREKVGIKPNTTRLPRNSVMTAINRAAIVNNTSIGSQIWTRDLFAKTDRQLAGLMSWSPKSITNSLLAATPKAYKRKACENFKQIQMYMGDKTPKVSKEKLAYAICSRGISSSAWANEIFMQLCKQVNFNPNIEKTFYGWELICICLKFFHPDSVAMKKSFEAFLRQYSAENQYIDSENVAPKDFDIRSHLCARAALKLFAMSNKSSELNSADIIEAKQTYSYPTVFHSALDEVMNVQSHLFHERRLPWILVALTEEIIRCDGMKIQGIMRVPSEQSKIEILTQAIEKAFRPHQLSTVIASINYNNSRQNRDQTEDEDECDPLLDRLLKENNLDHDPLLLSSILKNWFRHMPLSIIPFEEFSELSPNLFKDISVLMSKIEALPEINFLVFQYLIRFLQILAHKDNVQHTNMPVENLVTLMAPTLFKLEINELQPAMQLLQTLILYWDTNDIVGIR